MSKRSQTPIIQSGVKNTGRPIYKTPIKDNKESLPYKNSSQHSSQRQNTHSEIYSSLKQRKFCINSTSRSNKKESSLSNRIYSKNALRRPGTAEKQIQKFSFVRNGDERLTRGWLRLLNFTTSRSQENEPMLKNPFRNGTLLCDVIETLQKIVLKKKINNPSNISEAHDNIILALNTITKLYSERISKYLTDFEQIAEGILRGEHDIVWGILSRIRELYPQTEQLNPIPMHLVSTGLKCPLPEIIEMERNVINWLQSLHIIKKTDVTILDIEHRICSGTLLCEIAEILHNHDKKSYGIFDSPKSKSTELSNIKKAFKLFKQLPKFESKYIWNENKILNGNCGEILGLLNDLYHYYKISNRYESNDSFSRIEKKNAYYSKPIENLSPKSYEQYIENEIKLGKNEMNEIPLISTKHVSIPYPYPKNFHSSAINRSMMSNYSDNTKKIPDSKSEHKEIKNTLSNLLKEFGAKTSQSDIESLITIRNGTLLAKILGRLEGRIVMGINNHPKSTATSLHNIRKVLEILREKRQFPVKLFYAELEIQKGNIETIISLLEAMKSIYHPINKK